MNEHRNLKDSPPVRRRGKKPVVLRPWGRMMLRWAVRTAVVLLVLVLGALIAFRYFGLPEQINERLRTELSQRGLEVSFDKLYLDPLGRVVARDLRVRRYQEGTVHSLQIKRLRFGFNWVSWWRGESFLESASIDNADLSIPLDTQTAIRLRKVDAELEFRPHMIVVRGFEARLLNLLVSLRGTIDLEGFTMEAKPPDAEEMARRAKMWKQIEDYAAKIDMDNPLAISLQGDVKLGAPEKSRVRLRVDGSRGAYLGVLCEKIDIDVGYEDGLASLNGKINLLRGGLQLDGKWRWGEKETVVGFFCDADFSLLAPLAPGHVGDFLRDLRFRSLPSNEGTVALEWADGFHFHVQSRSNWQDFAIGDTNFDSLYLPVSYDGARLMIPGLELKGGNGNLGIQLFYDGKDVLKGHIESSVDPTHFKALFGAGAQPFFNSLQFHAGGPVFSCELKGTGLNPELIQAKGAVSASDLVYKGIHLQSVKADFDSSGFDFHLFDVFVKRKEGDASGELWYNPKTHMVKLKGARLLLATTEAARIVSSKLEEYVSPYRFFEAPQLTADGVIDVDNQKLTDLAVRVVSGKGMEYDFLGKTIVLSGIDADLIFKADNLDVVPRKPVGIFGGTMMGTLSLKLSGNNPYKVDGKLDDTDFGALMKTYFGNEEVKGKLDAGIRATGNLNDMASMDGWGDLVVTNGVLYSIPVFGGFSEVLNSIIPNLGYSEASKAQSSFRIKDGVITMDKIDVSSTAFALIGNGTYDYLKDDVDISMRVNVRGIIGIAFFPVSKLFEYRGTGTMHNTKWEPKSF